MSGLNLYGTTWWLENYAGSWFSGLADNFTNPLDKEDNVDFVKAVVVDALSIGGIAVLGAVTLAIAALEFIFIEPFTHCGSEKPKVA